MLEKNRYVYKGFYVLYLEEMIKRNELFTQNLKSTTNELDVVRFQMIR